MAWIYLSVSIFSIFFSGQLLMINFMMARYVRMLKSPALYGVGVDHQEDAEDGPPPNEGEAGDEELVIGGGSSIKGKGKATVDKDIVSPFSINGFWVQRQVSEVYPDSVTAADKAASVLSILGSESSLHDCETSSWSCSSIKASTLSPNSSRT